MKMKNLFLFLLESCCEMLKVPKTVQCTSQYYFHICADQLNDSDREVNLAAILNLAVKQNEISRKFRDILNVVYFILKKKLLKIDDNYWETKQKVDQTEFVILRILKFDTNVYLPHQFCIIIFYHLERDLERDLESSKLTFQKLCEASLAILTHSFKDSFVLPSSMHDNVLKRDHAWNLAISSVCLALKVLDLDHINFIIKGFFKKYDKIFNPKLDD